MSKIPTAEEFLNDKFKVIYKKYPESFTNKISEKRYLDLHVTGRIDGREQNYPEMMIEFAKLHVEAALKEASESIELDSKIESEYQGSLGNEEGLLYVNKEYFYIDKNSILNAYPLENIK